MPRGVKYATEEERLAARRASSRAAAKRYREKNPEAERVYRNVNREQILANQARYRETNREQERARSRAYHAANRTRRNEQSTQWRADNPEAWHAIQARATARRRSLERGDIGNLSSQEWQEILEEFDRACAYCQARGVRLEQEHITPLSRGGRHTKSNVVPACRSCNARKGAKTLFEFAAMG
jgi:5-methylcytosine-specific restriction endonuclease McrA